MYHVLFDPPLKPEICNKCGGELYQREDDHEDTVRKRLQIYNNETKPLLEFYGRIGLLSQIDGVGPTEEIMRRMLAAIGEARHDAGDSLEPRLVGSRPVDTWDRADEALRIGMARPSKELLDRGLLDHLAGIHHHDALGRLSHHAHGVRDQHDRHAEPRLQILQKLQDLGLDGHVERGGGLVRDQELGVA